MKVHFADRNKPARCPRCWNRSIKGDFTALDWLIHFALPRRCLCGSWRLPRYRFRWLWAAIRDEWASRGEGAK